MGQSQTANGDRQARERDRLSAAGQFPWVFDGRREAGFQETRTPSAGCNHLFPPLRQRTDSVYSCRLTLAGDVNCGD